MDIWLAIDGEKKGPYTLLEVQGKLRDDAISGDTIGWYKGCDSWRPIRSLAPFQEMLREKAEEEARETEEVESEAVARELGEEEEMANQMTGTAQVLARPWLRFWARNLDELLLFFILLGLLGLLKRLEITSVPYSWLFDPVPMVVSFLVSAFVESAFLATWGATPGKMLMGIRVENDGNPALGFKM
ncbi:MAG: RDD family protein, partial [Verrucomicrobiota bacterium]